jgi:hypothetical protein
MEEPATFPQQSWLLAPLVFSFPFTAWQPLSVFPFLHSFFASLRFSEVTFSFSDQGTPSCIH